MLWDMINVCEHGVVADSPCVQTDKIQNIIDGLAEKGGVIYFPKGKYITGTLFLSSDITIYMDNGAELLGSDTASDYDADYIGAIEAPSFSRCLIYAEKCRNIMFKGNGTINGRSVSFSDGRPMLMRFIECTDIEFEKISLKNAGSWGVHFIACEDIRISKVTLDSRVNSNNDGFDFDSCKNVFISDTYISSGDDSICLKSTKDYQGENFVITNCILSSDTAALKMGTSSSGGFKNIVMNNCVIRDCPMGTIKLIMVDGGILENVNINNIVMDNVGSPLFVRTGKRNMKFDKPKEMDYDTPGIAGDGEVGVIRNIMISDVQANVTVSKRDRTPIMITGHRLSPIENITLKNIRVSFPGGGTAKEALYEVPEDESRYPEQWFFGTLPAWGLYARHVRALELNKVILTLKSEDARKKIIYEDVTEEKDYV